MKYVTVIALAVLGVFAWSLSLVSADVVAMTIGMLLGGGGVAAVGALSYIAGNRPAPDDDIHYRHLHGSKRIYLSGSGIAPGFYRLESAPECVDVPALAGGEVSG